MTLTNILLFLVIYMAFFLASWLFPIDRKWYDKLKKPTFAPPGFVIGIVWTILYGLIALSILIVYNKYGLSKEALPFYAIFLLNYIVNQGFSYFEFKQKNLYLATIDCFFVALTTLILILLAKQLSSTASALLIPYFLWTSFATFLSWTIYKLNRG